MTGILVPRKKTVHADVSFGVCVWKMADGSFLKNEEGDYYCLQGQVGNFNIENRMRESVKTNFGITTGSPAWFPGFRQITKSEWEDQMERLMDGKVPDAVDLYLQNKDNNG
jgi:hypothetical protein